jgi:hypothetical protein
MTGGPWARFHPKEWLYYESTFLLHYFLLLDDFVGANAQIREYALQMTRMRVVQGRQEFLPSVSSIFEADLSFRPQPSLLSFPDLLPPAAKVIPRLKVPEGSQSVQ